MKADRGKGYHEVSELLRSAYDSSARQRDEMPKTPWKLAEREAFLDRLKGEGKARLLEVGAGTGHDSLYFAEHGLSVTATDLSPEMVALCRAKGLDAHVMDFLHLDFQPATFDAIYAVNCLLHVPNADFLDVMSAMKALLTRDGLFFLGVYGGEPFEGVAPDDRHTPPRFFSFRSDEQIQALASERFAIVDFHVVEPHGDARDAASAIDAVHFQSLTLRSTD